MFDLMQNFGDGKLIKSKTGVDEGRFSRPTNSANHAFWAPHHWLLADRQGLSANCSNGCFPGPLVVFESLAREALSGELWVHLSATLGQVVAAFGRPGRWRFYWCASRRSDAMDRWFWPWVNVFEHASPRCDCHLLWFRYD